MQERRQFSRHRTLKSGQIVVQPHASVFDCTIRNLSPKGALLVMPSLAAIPDKFDLVDIFRRSEDAGQHVDEAIRLFLASTMDAVSQGDGQGNKELNDEVNKLEEELRRRLPIGWRSWREPASPAAPSTISRRRLPIPTSARAAWRSRSIIPSNTRCP